jgi:hypothetical protein
VARLRRPPGECKSIGEATRGNRTMPLTPDQMRTRTAERLAEESVNPEHWMYFSFSKDKEDGGFQGAIFIKTKGIVHARIWMARQGINPKGEMLGTSYPESMMIPSEEYRNRLLTKKELELACGELNKTDGTPVPRSFPMCSLSTCDCPVETSLRMLLPS